MFKLRFVEVIVQAPICQQVRMRSDLYDSPILHGDNFVSERLTAAARN